MKNLTFIYVLAFLTISLQLSAQVNMNPDPNGEPWWSGDAVLPSAEEIAMIPELVITLESENLLLPYKVYNDDHIFFPPILYQQGSSCVHAAEIGYNFTYEINRARNVAAGNWGTNKENCYHYLFTYNFVNNGSGSTYTSFTGGFKIIKENGCPSYEVYDDPSLYSSDKFKYWMTDFENYNSGMSNQISEYNTIYFNTSYSSLDNLKHWLADHGEGAETGGLAIIAINTSGWNTNSTIPIESPEEPGEKMITQWGTSNGHALSIVGYNNEIWCFDINNDGEYTMDEDVNGDGIVDLLDCEKGAFKIANSWGTNWGNDGFIFVPYKLMASNLKWPNHAYICKSQGNYEPLLEIKTSIEYPKRNKLGFKVGYAQNANQTIPVSSTLYNSFKYQGGSYQMRGAYDGSIEIGLNYGYWYLNEDVGKIFFIIDENENNTPSDGEIEYFSIIDYRWEEEFELYCDETNIAIVNNDETMLSIDYDLIPHESNITSNLSLFSNMVSRFTPTVDNNAILTVEDGVRIDMYDSEIHIKPGSSLVLDDDVTFLAKKGSCKLVIDGNIIIGSNVKFLAADGAQLEVLLNNHSLQTIFNNTSFENTRLNSYAQSLTITNSSFEDCNLIHSYRGNITVTDGTIFDRTWLYLENTEDNLSTATVTNCIFITDITMAAIDLWNYNQYNITNNIIQGYYNGIQIFQSGYGELKTATISDNTITNCTHCGILTYNTRGAFYRNHIYDNGYGVWLADHSNVRLFGDYDAQSNAETQEIHDNQSYEVYASQYSFPPYFRYNVIVDDDNNLVAPDDPLVYHSGKISLKDVRYNCWEEIAGSFVAAEDFYPTGYMWQPMWCPGDNMNNTPDPDEDMYAIAGNLFEAEDYVSAKTMYQTLIDQFPESKYAKAAMQELFALEKFATNDYNTLQQYYTTNTAIQSDTALAESAAFLSSKCDVKTQNWPDAISYYENIILVPETMEDSIFAIINLGYVYFMMENSGYKSAHTGNLVQYKPETKEQFFDDRDYLLSLLPGDQTKNATQENLAQLNEGELLQNVPNPFKGETQILYKLENESSVQLNIYNYTGQLISQINEGTKTKGTHQTTLDATGLANGIYFYSISINGQTTDTRKMTIVK